jgi:hypothetical protein
MEVGYPRFQEEKYMVVWWVCVRERERRVMVELLGCNKVVERKGLLL